MTMRTDRPVPLSAFSAALEDELRRVRNEKIREDYGYD